MRKKFALIALAAVVALVAAACGSSNNNNNPGGGGSSTGQKQITAAWIYVGSKSDAGWTQQHDLGREAVVKAFGNQVKTIYKENVPEGPQTASAINALINQGANIIFSTSFGFQDAMVAAAKAHPDIKFEQATGTALAPNMSEYFGAGEDADYLSGMAAGYATTSGKIGYVAPFPIPEVIREIDAYTTGAQYVHPGATVKVVWTNSWFDPAKERQAAQSLVASGVDVLGDGVDDPAVGEVAQANNLKWTGYDSDQGQFAPDAFLTATVFDWGPYYVQEVKAVLDGTWKSNFYYGTIADGMIGIAPYGKSVTQEAQDAINKRMGEIKDGSFNPFTGPLTKQDGSPGLAAGKTLPVYDVNNPDTPSKYNINWFVQGVIGSASG
jgi:basic membrane protein A